MNKNDKKFLIEKIRTQYTEKENSRLDELKALDKKVKRPAKIFAYIIGSIAAIVMGSGMSLIMTDIGSILGITKTMVPGILIGVVGILMAILNYPLYKGILGSRCKKYSGEIIALSDELLEEEGEDNV